jgi:WD40 repeat protein
MASRSKVLLVSGGYDHSIRFWDVTSGTMVKQLQVVLIPTIFERL